MIPKMHKTIDAPITLCFLYKYFPRLKNEFIKAVIKTQAIKATGKAAPYFLNDAFSNYNP